MKAANYCVGFVDLLGQRAEYKNEGLIPKNDDERNQFYQKIERTIKPIYQLQEDALGFIEAAFRNEEFWSQISLSPSVKPNQQRWSDGYVYFVSLENSNAEQAVSGIYYLLGAVGMLCFLGLSKKHPLRGGVDIAWGVVLHKGEIYGPALANAYELESEVAQYPRIVISERTIEYIKAIQGNALCDYYRQIATCCMDMIGTDFDGNYFLDYLGSGFKSNITKEKHNKIYELAFQFVSEQLDKWTQEKNTKLSIKYRLLYSYFEK